MSKMLQVILYMSSQGFYGNYCPKAHLIELSCQYKIEYSIPRVIKKDMI
jgi:hypothetical protein